MDAFGPWPENTCKWHGQWISYTVILNFTLNVFPCSIYRPIGHFIHGNVCIKLCTGHAQRAENMIEACCTRTFT